MGVSTYNHGSRGLLQTKCILANYKQIDFIMNTLFFFFFFFFWVVWVQIKFWVYIFDFQAQCSYGDLSNKAESIKGSWKSTHYLSIPVVLFQSIVINYWC